MQCNSIEKASAHLAHLLVRGRIVREKGLLAVRVLDEVGPELGAVEERLVSGQPQQLRRVRAVLLQALEV